jgi:hypothetical protein
MARQRTVFWSSKSIAGAALLGFGLFVLYENLAGAAVCVCHVLGADRSHAIGILPAFILAVSQFFDTHAANPHRFLECSVQHMLLSSWPLLLVVAGTAMSCDSPPESVSAPAKKDFELVDLTAGRSTLK